MREVEVQLPGGLRGDGGLRRTATLRPLSGQDELFLLEETRMQSPAARTTALLARCVTRLGEYGPVDPADIRRLCIGDRETLLLHLRRLTFGDKLACLLTCPNPHCGKPMELELSTEELLVPVDRSGDEVHETCFDSAAGRYRVRFRLPNGEDQEAVALVAVNAPETAAAALLKRCVHEAIRDDSEEGDTSLPASVADQISATMAELDPQAETVLELRCPECKLEFCASLDLAGFFYQELLPRGRSLYHQIHILACSYHWSEEAILALTHSRRQLYLDLLCGTATESAHHG
jgi:hypothetical protein